MKYIAQLLNLCALRTTSTIGQLATTSSIRQSLPQSSQPSTDRPNRQPTIQTVNRPSQPPPTIPTASS